MILLSIFLCFEILCGTVRASQDDKPQPYNYGYVIKDKDSSRHHQEVSDGKGNVKGSYAFMDDKGIQWRVDYVADHNGYRAQIKTNAPGTTGANPASVNMISNDPYARGADRPYNSKVDVPYVPALHVSDGEHGLPTVLDFHDYAINESTDDGEEYHDDSYVDGIADSNTDGGKPKGIVYYGANLVGGRITGYDSRFSG